jgi:peroxiredoxin
MKKQILLFTCLLLVVFACDKKTYTYQIEGNLSNLKDSTLFAVFSKNEFRQIDTIACAPDGSFKIGTDTLFETMTILNSSKARLINIYLDSCSIIKIDGDANVPELAQVKGGQINDKLTEFKNLNKDLLLERRNLHSKLVENKKTGADNSKVTPQLINVKHEIKSKVTEFIEANNTEIASTILIQHYFMDKEDVRKLDELLNTLDPSIRKSCRGKRLDKFSAQVKRTAVGSKAPSFKVKNIDNKTVSLQNYKGTTVLLTFAAPWCEICKEDKQYLTDIRKKYPEKKLKMLTVTLNEQQDSIRANIKKSKQKWDIIADSADYASELVELYGVNSVPSNFIIDSTGVIQVKSKHLFETKQLLKEFFSK